MIEYCVAFGIGMIAGACMLIFLIGLFMMGDTRRHI